MWFYTTLSFRAKVAGSSCPRPFVYRALAAMKRASSTTFMRKTCHKKTWRSPCDCILKTAKKFRENGTADYRYPSVKSYRHIGL